MCASNIPIDFVTQGSFHQGSDRFPIDSRGRQCVANAVFSCVFNHVTSKPFILWTGGDIDDILQNGDFLYRHARQFCQCVYLEPCELPSYFCLQGQKVKCSVVETYSGDIGQSFTDCGDFFSLETALTFCLTDISHMAVLICNHIAVSVNYCEPFFHVFDSHSRNAYGQPCSEGAASIFSFLSLTTLTGFLRQVFGSKETSAFDVHKIKTCTILTVSTFKKVDEVKRICFRTETNSSPCRTCNKPLTVMQKFHNAIKYGPDFVCTCCSQTWFKEGVKKASLVPEVMRTKCNLSQSDHVCITCFHYLRLEKIPPCSKVNGLEFPARPKELDLTSLEERLVAPRIPFMQLREKPRGGQLSISGNVVNVPADVTSTVKKLPRLLSEDETISLKFKRNLSFNHCVAFERIRPHKVFAAATWLVENSELFQQEGIQVNFDWLQSQDFNEENAPNSACESVQHTNALETISKSPNLESSTIDEISAVDSWTEVPNINDRPTGNIDTILQCLDFREFNEVLSVAPGQFNSPLGLYQDKNAEYLSFPTIYCGQIHCDNTNRLVPLHYSTICKWELRNVDRRSALCIPNIFFKMKKLQIKYVRDKVMLAVRKCKLNNKKYTADQMLDPKVTDGIVHLNEGYQVLRNLRGSPPYWEMCKKDVFALIRQLGIPTWFCSFSAAETKWVPLLITLGKLVEKKDYTEDEAANLSWEEKSKLIKSDPVTCARYFDYRFQRFMSEVLRDRSHPIGEIVDYFYRIEFQQRGSPHVHMLLWIKNAPTTDNSQHFEIIKFIDKYLTCSNNAAKEFLVNYQTHRHARSCMKKNKPICRFNFPIAPMPHTDILYPLEDQALLESSQENYKKISMFLNSPEMRDSNLSFEEFLLKLEMNFETYKLALRSSLKQPRIFLRRRLNEIRINLYNPTLLECWLANMDIQYILDPYACASYIVSYISKGQRGMSNLLHKACEEAKRTDSDIRQQVRHIGNQFLTHVEVGAQEAAYMVLQMPLRRTSRSVLFINTSPPDERVVLMKPKHVLEEMNQESTDVESGNILSLYQQRPKALETICLADFVSNFSVKRNSHKVAVGKSSADGFLPEVDYNEDISDLHVEENEHLILEQTYTLRNGTQLIKRKKPSVLRWVHFDIEIDSEKYYREQIMLFVHWRKEDELIKPFQSFRDRYVSCHELIEKKRTCYEKGAAVMHDLENMIINEDDICMDLVAPGSEHMEQIDFAEGTRKTKLFGCFDPGQDAESYDVGLDLGISRKHIEQEETSKWGELDDEQYRLIVKQLNEQQKTIFFHVLHWVKTKDEPFHIFLTGGAGVGKSVVTKAIYQGVMKFYAHQLHVNPDNVHVLVCAPTGKAAHNIKGCTIHSAFCLPVGQGFKYKPLDMQQLNCMRTKFSDLKLLIIDEISMVGRGMFDFINIRLQEIKGCKRPFGGISVIAVGDLFQLKPVMDNWIFLQPCSEYGPIAANLWQDHFKIFELTEVMRQKDDRDFAHLLNRLREGTQTENDIAVLQDCVVQQNDMPAITHLPHLFTTRKEVDDYNGQIFMTADSNFKISVTAIDWVMGSVDENVQEKVLSRVPKDSSKTVGLSCELKLVIGIPAEITNNVNVRDGVTNGSACIIKKFDYRVHGSDRVSIIWVQFEESSIGQELRTELSHLYAEGIHKEWTPILEITRMFSVRMNSAFQVKRRQFPLQLAAAKTIHKAQGSTLNSAVVHFGSRKNDHIHYVGLSRVTHIKSLHILQLNEGKISVSARVIEEMERLRFNASLRLCLDNLHTHPLTALKIVFFNIRSLHKHIADLQTDFSLLSSDIIGVSETRLLRSDNDSLYQLPGFSLYRFDFEKESPGRPSYGLALYIRESVTFRKMNKKYIDKIQCFSIEVACSTQWITVTLIYLPPKLTLRQATEVLRMALEGSSGPYLLAGDTNFDCQFAQGLQKFILEEFGLQYLETNSTTDYKTIIDQAFTNLLQEDIYSWGTLESYYSDHKPLFVSLK